MANLFTDDLTQVTLRDVEQFLNLQAPATSRMIEGPRLDFKRDVPQDLGRDVAGLANRYGGLILIGVETDRTKRNVPASLAGTGLGNDPRARLANMILASVHPRPDFEIQPIAVSDPQKSVAVIRVAEGTFPPYEFSQGATVGIPIRIEDTTRQATLQEIEGLLRNRGLAAREPEQVVEQYLKASDFFCSVEGGGPQGNRLVPDPLFLQLILAPRVPARRRLDLTFERELCALIWDVYRPEQNFVRAAGGQASEDGFKRRSLFQEYEFRISGRSPCHRVWRVWSDGTLGFVANHSRVRTPEPVGNFALEALLFLRLARRLFESQGYFGPSVMAYQIACPSHQFEAAFPSADFTLVGAYDDADGVYFDGPSPGQPDHATCVEEVQWETFSRPEGLVAGALLDLLRAVAGARVDYERLLGHVTRLSQGLP
jgi:hypothetical protein